MDLSFARMISLFFKALPEGNTLWNVFLHEVRNPLRLIRRIFKV
jgi:hypothetical protein